MSITTEDGRSSDEAARNDAPPDERGQEALRQSEAKYRSLFESIDEGFCIIEMIFDERGNPMDYRFDEVNPAFERQTGLIDACGKTVRELVPEHEEHWFEIFGRVALTGEAIRFQHRAAQLHRWYDVYSWRYGKPQDRQVAVLFNDVTSRKQAEESLRQSERRLRLALDAAYTIAFEWDIPRNQVRRHVSFVTALPETPQEQPSSLEQVCAAVHPDDRERFLENVHAALAHPEQGYRGEYRLCEPDGRIVWLSEHGYLEYDHAGRPQRLIGLSQDVTKQKVAEEQARLRLAELEDIYRNAPVGLCLLDRELRFLRVNERLAEINGIPAAEHIGKTLREVVPKVADMAEPSLREVVETGQPRFDVELIGETLARPGVQRTWLEHWLPVKDPEGRIIGVNIVVEEITERKQAEEALRRANRRKDAFLATLAHELRNPLAPIRTGLDLLHALRGDAAACEEPLRIMNRQLSHLTHLVDDLLDLSRISRDKIELRKEHLDLADVIDAALDISESRLSRDDRRLTISMPSNPLPVEGDRERLVQVVSNLLNNAAKFTDAGGQITLRAVRRGDRAEIRVQDDGRGIPPERITEIFEMFSQSEPGRDAGLGIGLSIVRSLVALHGGTVSAESEGPGRGATFTVSLPLCDSLPAQPRPREATTTDAIPTRRVLVVDDNRDIAESLRLLLMTLNAEVRVAHTGAEALRICTHWQPTHVLMDLGMPGMDGFETARRLRANHPERDFRLIAISGWGQHEDRERSREAGFEQHLVKPVGVAEIRALLSS